MVGGYVVRDRELRSLNGRYVYADLCAGELRSFVPGLDGARKDRAVGPTVPSPTSFGEGARGRIYVASHGGRVWKLVTAQLLRGGALAAAIVALAILAPGSAAGAISAKEVGDFNRPTYVHGPDGAGGALFVVERAGRIEVIQGGRRRDRPFLDIEGRCRAARASVGLFSVAFAPDYATSGRLYVYFTDRQGDIRVEEYRRSAEDPLRAQTGSRRKVIEIRHRAFPNHNGGQLQFGPDGLLYLGTGDGGGAATRARTRRAGKPARKAAPHRPAQPAGGPGRRPALEPVREGQGRERDLRARAAQPLAILVRRQPGS